MPTSQPATFDLPEIIFLVFFCAGLHLFGLLLRAKFEIFFNNLYLDSIFDLHQILRVSWKISPHVLGQMPIIHRWVNMEVEPNHLIPSLSHVVFTLIWNLLEEASYGNRNSPYDVAYCPLKTLTSCLIYLLSELHFVLGSYLHPRLHIVLDSLLRGSALASFFIKWPYYYARPSRLHH